jgi:hypothetical protein
LDLVFEAFRNIGEKQALQWFVEIFERTGTTFEENILGAKGIDTVEPDNIESILATKFSGKMLGFNSSWKTNEVRVMINW